MSLHCLCCKWCQIGVLPGQVAAHLSLEVHRTKGLKVDQAKLDEVLEEMDVFECFPVTPETNAEDAAPPPYEGLAIHQGFQCTRCTKMTQSAEYMQKHYSSKHPGESRVDGWRQCSIQRFTPAGVENMPMWFRVAPVETPEVDTRSLEERILTEMKQEMKKYLDVQHRLNNVDARNISPWLKTTKWHEHLITRSC